MVLIARKRLNVYKYIIERNIDNVIVFIIRSSRDVSTVPKTFSGVLLTTLQVLVTRQGNIGQVIPHLMVYLASKKNYCWTIIKKVIFVFLGNDVIHAITSQCKYELKIILTDFQQHTKIAKYSSFSVGDKSTKYALSISGYSGDAGWYHWFILNRYDISLWFI